MSLPDYDVLTALSVTGGGRMSITVLAAQIGWERGRMSHHVRRMTARAWYVRPVRRRRRRRRGYLDRAGAAGAGGGRARHVDLVRPLFFGDSRPAWWGRSARNWKTCTPTSTTGLAPAPVDWHAARTDHALPLPAPSRAGRQPGLPCPGQVPLNENQRHSPFGEIAQAVAGVPRKQVPAKPPEAPAPVRGARGSGQTNPARWAAPAPQVPVQEARGAVSGDLARRRLPVANYVMCHIRLRDMSRTLTRSASDRPAGGRHT